ncbi:MAG: helix-turn-helix domain-containing protein [Planctomycetota bacterium]
MSASPAQPQRRSCCPVACTLDLLGDRWTLLVIRDLMRGVDRYSDFAASPEKIATNILADRLDQLVAHGIAERFTPPGRKHPRYRLTDRGHDLRPVLGAVADWGLRHIPGTEARLAPPSTPSARRTTSPARRTRNTD